MTWVKLDDRFDDNRKVRAAWRLQEGSLGLYVMALTYVARNELDGQVDQHWLEERVPNRRRRTALCSTLVECSLFEQVDDGYAIHDYLDFNPSRSELAERREKDRRRKSGGNDDGDSGTLRSDSVGNPDGIHPPRARRRAPGGAGRDGTGRDGKPSSKSVDQDSFPSSLSEDLTARANKALAVLRAVQGERGGNEPSRRGVGLAVGRFPDRDHVGVVRELEHWALAGTGQNRVVKDWARTYATFLERSPAGAPVAQLASREPSMAEFAASLARHSSTSGEASAA